jgi:hypothetical protein
MFNTKLKTEIESPINHIKKVLKRSREIMSENPEISEPEARKIASEEIRNKLK